MKRRCKEAEFARETAGQKPPIVRRDNGTGPAEVRGGRLQGQGGDRQRQGRTKGHGSLREAEVDTGGTEAELHENGEYQREEGEYDRSECEQ